MNSTTFKSWLAVFTWEVCKSPGTTSSDEYLTICAELPPDARPDEVRRFFESVGPIRECRVMKGTLLSSGSPCRSLNGLFNLRKATVLLSMKPKRSPFTASFYVTLSKALLIHRMQMNALRHSTPATFKDVLSSWSLPRKTGGASPIWIARTLQSSRTLSVILYTETLTIIIRLVLQSPSTWNSTTCNWLGERC